MERYSAKLLFQFRVTVGGDSGKRRLCEERIVVFRAISAKQALARAKRRGRREEHHYTNDEGNSVHFEFIGVMELLHMGLECEEDEVWWTMRERLTPSERKDRLIPPESLLHAIRIERESGGHRDSGK